MFSFFKKKPKMPEVSDKVWMSDKAKSMGFANDLKGFVAQQQKVCIFYYFEDTLKQLTSNLRHYNIELINLERSQSSSSVIAVPALEFEFSMRLQNNLKSFIETGHTVLVFAEHYPLLSKEKAVLEKLATLSDATLKTCFYVSLEEPLIKVFGSDNIIELMKKMGMKEDEALEHNMISSALNNAQKKMDTKVQNDSKADSAVEWFKRNVKS